MHAARCRASHSRLPAPQGPADIARCSPRLGRHRQSTQETRAQTGVDVVAGNTSSGLSLAPYHADEPGRGGLAPAVHRRRPGDARGTAAFEEPPALIRNHAATNGTGAPTRKNRFPRGSLTLGFSNAPTPWRRGRRRTRREPTLSSVPVCASSVTRQLPCCQSPSRQL